MQKKGHEEYQNLSEEEKEKNNNMVTNDIKSFPNMKSKVWLSIGNIILNVRKNVYNVTGCITVFIVYSTIIFLSLLRDIWLLLKVASLYFSIWFFYFLFFFRMNMRDFFHLVDISFFRTNIEKFLSFERNYVFGPI